MIKRWPLLSSLLVLSVLMTAQSVTAQKRWVYEEFEGPDQSQLYVPDGINNYGAVSGTYGSLSGGGSFVDRHGDFSTFGDANTYLMRINDRGTSVGFFFDQSTNACAPFIRYRNGIIDNMPRISLCDEPWAINDSGYIAGTTSDGSPFAHGVIWHNGVVKTFDYPGATDTEFTGINNAGKIVGNCNLFFFTAPVFAFMLEKGVYTPLSIPGGTNIHVFGINNKDQMVGSYLDSHNHRYGYIYDHGAVTKLDCLTSVYGLFYTDPSGKVYKRNTSTTYPHCINDKGQIAGFLLANYIGTDGTGSVDVLVGFIATAVDPKE